MTNSKMFTPTKTAAAPRLDVLMSWWTMNGIGEEGREWSIEEKFRRIAEAGYDGINGSIPSSELAMEWNRLLEHYGLSFSVNAYPRTAKDMREFICNVKAYGPVSFINTQVLTPFLTDQSAEALLLQLHDISQEAGIPVFIETHSGTITQDLIRTVQYVDHLEALRLTIDFSHYVVAGEMHTISDEQKRFYKGCLLVLQAFMRECLTGSKSRLASVIKVSIR